MAVARALISRPAVVFADEPTGNLDSKSSQMSCELLRQAVDDFAQTVVMVTHDAHAASFADRLLVLGRRQDRARWRGCQRRAGARPDEGDRLMSKLVLRGFAQRKVRALLTGIAIVLGVALMAGTYILTDTINHAFAEVFGNAYKNKAVVVTAKETLGTGEANRQTYPISEATLARVRAVSGVAAASGDVSTQSGPADEEW